MIGAGLFVTKHAQLSWGPFSKCPTPILVPRKKSWSREWACFFSWRVLAFPEVPFSKVFSFPCHFLLMFEKFPGSRGQNWSSGWGAPSICFSRLAKFPERVLRSTDIFLHEGSKFSKKMFTCFGDGKRYLSELIERELRIFKFYLCCLPVFLSQCGQK